ncbi:MAG: PRC-barrel domain-containing protein [Promethearchaeota archaeon]
MLKSQRGFLASELCQYCVIDRYSKKIGKITDLLANPFSYLIEYIVVENHYLIPVSLIDNDNSSQKNYYHLSNEEPVNKLEI